MEEYSAKECSIVISQGYYKVMDLALVIPGKFALKDIKEALTAYSHSIPPYNTCKFTFDWVNVTIRGFGFSYPLDIDFVTRHSLGSKHMFKPIHSGGAVRYAFLNYIFFHLLN